MKGTLAASEVYVPEIIKPPTPKISPYLWKTPEQIAKMKEEEAKRKEEIAKMDFSYDQLRKMNTMAKQDYIDRILNEDA